MERLLDFVASNPLYAAGLAALGLLLLVALIKKMLKVAILTVVLSAGYVYYLQDAAEKAYADAQHKVDDAAEKATDKAGNLMDKAGNLIK